MKTLHYYIFRRTAALFLLSATILLMALSLERLLRLIQAVNDHSAPIYNVLELLFYLLPHYMSLAIPAALFLSILLVMRRLLDDSELNIIQSAGVSLRALYQPLLFIIIPTTLFLLVFSGYIQPHGRHTYRATLHELATHSPLGSIRPGTFHELDEETTLRAEKIQNSEGYLEGIFISRKKKNPSEHIIIGAQYGRLVQNLETMQSTLLLENGNLKRETQDTNTISTLKFNSYSWNIPGTFGEPYGPRGQDEREMNFNELLNGHTNFTLPKVNLNTTHTEFHARVVQALSVPFLVLWAVPLAFIGGGRTGKALGLVLGVGLLVFYEKVLGFGEAYAANGLFHPIVALWTPLFILGLSGWFIMIHMIPKHLKLKKA